MKISLKPNKHDIFVGAFLFILIASLIISLVSLKSSDDHYVYVKYDGEIIHQMDLHVNEVYLIEKDDEKFKNLHGDFEVTVKNGKVAITKNVCPEDFCKHLGWIDSKGYSLICAPNRMVVEIGKKVEINNDWGPGGIED